MFSGLLIAVGAGSVWTLSGVMNSCCAKFKLSITTYLLSNVLCSFVLSLIFRVVYRNLSAGDLKIIGILFAAGMLNTGGALLLQHALSRGYHGIVFLISQSAIVFPFLAGLFLFDERPSAVRLIGCIGIFLGMASCSLPKLFEKNGNGRGSCLWLILSILSFLSFGLAQVLMTVPSWKTIPDPAHVRTAALYAGSTVMMCLYTVFARNVRLSFSKKLAVCGIAVSILNLVSMGLMFFALDILARYNLSAVGFPLAIASSMAGFTLYSILILKEKCGPFILAELNCMIL